MSTPPDNTASEAKPTPTSLYLAVCVGDHIFVDTVTCLVSLFQHTPCHAQFFRGSMVPSQRQLAVKEFCKTHHTHLLFVDSDMVFPPDLATRLLAAGVGVIGCDYRKRTPPHGRVTTFYAEPPLSGIVRVESLATGLMLIRRDIIEAMSPPHFTYPFDLDKGAHQTEDTFFCHRCFEQNIPVYVDCGLSQEVGHIASIVLKL